MSSIATSNSSQAMNKYCDMLAEGQLQGVSTLGSPVDAEHFLGTMTRAG